MFVMWCILPFCILINGISSEYDPLDTNGIPESYDRTLPTLTCQQVADKLRKAKKSMSMVPGDTNPLLYNRHASRLAVPITSIYNAITQSKQQTTPASAGISLVRIFCLKSTNLSRLNGLDKRSFRSQTSMVVNLAVVLYTLLAA